MGNEAVGACVLLPVEGTLPIKVAVGDGFGDTDTVGVRVKEKLPL